MEIIKNYLYNMLYQIFTLIMPLITVPYVSRVLGKEGVGMNSYTLSIVQYFVLIGMVGITLYGNRSVARVRDNKSKLSETFLSIYYLQLITCTFAIICYIMFIIIFVKEDKIIYCIQSLYLFSAAIDISWLFMGLEQFRKTVTRNLIIKIIGLAMVFLFVKHKTDVWVYSLILGTSMFLGQGIMWGYLKSTIKFIKVDRKMIYSHLMPSLALFLPQIAIQVYLLLNKTMIGVIASKGEVGLFESSEKIVKMTLAIVTSLGTVMLPRISNTFAKGDFKKVNSYIIKSLEFVSLLSVPIMFGLAGIAKEFVPWFFGKEFLPCREIIMIISPIVFLIAWSNVLGIQYMIPTGKNREFTISVTVGAVVNLILNLFLIKYYQAFGAAISTVIAEAFVTITQIVILKKEINILESFDEVVKCFISAIVMFLVVRVIGNAMGTGVLTTTVQGITGAFVYIIAIVILRSKLVLEILAVIKKKINIV